MWTRGKDKQAAGKFAYEVFGMDGALIESVGGFDTAQAADRAAEHAQRVALFGDAARLTLTDIIDSMSDDELVAELLG